MGVGLWPIAGMTTLDTNEADSLATIEAACDAVIAVGGRYGTLSEIALALKLGRPVVGLGTWRLAQPDGRRVPLLTARTPEDAVARALRAARRAGRGHRGWLA